jgi:V/A-type H+-transporting ATPase subunit D
MERDLKIRLTAMPTLQAKESALRIEVKKARDEMDRIRERLDRTMREASSAMRLWSEFPDVVAVKEVKLSSKNIAGVYIPIVEAVRFDEEWFSFFSEPYWVVNGARIVRDTAEFRIHLRVAAERLRILEYARKKTTQKVNLYQKVQIPGYQEAIRKIKRFLEDDENLAKSSQKILKSRKEREA